MSNADFVEIRPDAGEDLGWIVHDISDSERLGGTGGIWDDMNEVGDTMRVVYDPGSSGQIDVVGYLDGNGTVLQSYTFGED